MSALADLPDMLVAAERAATAGDLTSAETLLRDVARIQAAELGPLHPDLANTLNNLAIVAEQTGRPDDAETFYRRAVAVASAALPADHPMVAASRQNLEDFCRARGLPIDGPAVMQPPAPVLRPAASTTALASPPAAHQASRSRAMVAIGVVVLAAAAVLARRPWSSPETPAPAAPVTTPAAAPVAARPPAPPPIEQASPIEAPPVTAPAPVKPAPPINPPPPIDPPPQAERAPSPVANVAISLATVQLCKTLSTSSATWQCNPADDSAAPGTIVLYTRVRSPRDAVIVHRWYRGDTLRQSVTLKIRASPTEGYRTYSRQVVDSGADWRVEVLSESGDLLHERRFTVR